MKIMIIGANELDFAKRAFFLAYNACPSSRGMGVFQEARLGGVEATEQQVWDNVRTRGDYPGHMGKAEHFYGDYVFGRMMKWGVFTTDRPSTLKLTESNFRTDYQSFCRVYPTQDSLLDATAKSLGCKWEVMEEIQ